MSCEKSLSPADYVSADQFQDVLNAYFAENHSLIRVGEVDYSTIAPDESDSKRTDIGMRCTIISPPDLVGTSNVSVFIVKNGDRIQLSRAWVLTPHHDISCEGELLPWLNAVLAAKGHAITITDIDMSEVFLGNGDWAARHCRLDPGPVQITAYYGCYNNIVMYSRGEGRVDIRYVGETTAIDLQTAQNVPIEGLIWGGIRYSN